MNAFKKYIRRKGFKLESDYDTIPYYIKGKPFQSGAICITDIYVDSGKALVFITYNVINEMYRFKRDGSYDSEIIDSEWEYYNKPFTDSIIKA